MVQFEKRGRHFVEQPSPPGNESPTAKLIFLQVYTNPSYKNLVLNLPENKVCLLKKIKIKKKFKNKTS